MCNPPSTPAPPGKVSSSSSGDDGGLGAEAEGEGEGWGSGGQPVVQTRLCAVCELQHHMHRLAGPVAVRPPSGKVVYSADAQRIVYRPVPTRPVLLDDGSKGRFTPKRRDLCGVTL